MTNKFHESDKFDDLSTFRFSESLLCSDGSELIVLEKIGCYSSGFYPGILMRKWSDGHFEIIYRGRETFAHQKMDEIWRKI